MSPLRYEVDPATMVDPEPTADTSALPTSRGPATAPAARPSLLTRYRSSVWVPVAAKAAGIALVMLGLAGEIIRATDQAESVTAAQEDLRKTGSLFGMRIDKGLEERVIEGWVGHLGRFG